MKTGFLHFNGGSYVEFNYDNSYCYDLRYEFMFLALVKLDAQHWDIYTIFSLEDPSSLFELQVCWYKSTNSFNVRFRNWISSSVTDISSDWTLVGITMVTTYDSSSLVYTSTYHVSVNNANVALFDDSTSNNTTLPDNYKCGKFAFGAIYGSGVM